MTLRKSNILSFFISTALFLVFFTAKKPLEFLLESSTNNIALIIGVFLFFLTCSTMIFLLKNGRFMAGVFHLIFMLTLLPAAMVNGSEFGIYKVFSLNLMMNLVVVMYMINGAFNLKSVLLMMAHIFIFYGLFSAVFITLTGYNFEERAVIGLNGPIVFGQYMVISFAIYMMYGKLIKGFVSFLLSFLSNSKGPFIAAIYVFIGNSRSKIKVTLMLLLLLTIFINLTAEMNFRIFELYNLDESNAFSARFYQYEQFYLLITDSVLGIGVGNWSDFSTLKYPHNIFLEILIELPLFLGLLFIFFVAYLFLKIRDRNYKILFLTMLIFSLFSGSILDNRGLFFITLLFLLGSNNRVVN